MTKKISGKPTPLTPVNDSGLSGPVALFLPMWKEAALAEHILAQIDHLGGGGKNGKDIHIFFGCYPNDRATLDIVGGITSDRPDCSLVINPQEGPTTKGDCLNQIWANMLAFEAHCGRQFSALIVHDAEDMLHPDSLVVHRHYLGLYDMVQLPVVPFCGKKAGWNASHYADEFAEAHGKTLRVRCGLGAGLPAAGVGCSFRRGALEQLAMKRGGQPFCNDSLVEDYELGLLLAQAGARSALPYHKGEDGRLIGTYALFPQDLSCAVRQKGRWLTGIALAGWDRLGWHGTLVENWMRLHDRRAVLAAIVLLLAYFTLIVTLGLQVVQLSGLAVSLPASGGTELLLGICLGLFLWRLLIRASFVRRLYGWRQAFLSVPRQFLANIIAIMAAWRAVRGYIRHLRGAELSWEKTDHTYALTAYQKMRE